MADLGYLVAEPDARIEAALAFVFRNLGIAARPVAPPTLWDGPHLVYGEGPLRPNGIVIPRRPGDRIWDGLISGAIRPAAGDGYVPFDVVGAIASFLGDDVHSSASADDFDAHDRLRHSRSVVSRAGIGDVPVVNRYVAYLGELIRLRLGVAGRDRWPDGRVAAIGLSHDVDHPDRYAFLGSAIRPWRLRRGSRTYVRRAIQLARQRLRDPDPHAYWMFDQVTATELERGFRSTWFFSTVPFHRNAGSAEDVAYDVRQPRFRSAIRALERDGFDIGLHASYRAFEDPARLIEERQALAAVADREIDGIRHHYWHLGPDVEATLRAHERAGFSWDSSLAFNDHVGFRRGVALPFQPWDRTLGRPLRLLELPPFCMDGNLFYGSSDVDAAVATVDFLVDAIARTGGIGSIDWHIQTSFPSTPEFRNWGRAYLQILDLLAARRDVWTTDLGSIARWAAGADARIGGPAAGGSLALHSAAAT